MAKGGKQRFFELNQSAVTAQPSALSLKTTNGLAKLSEPNQRKVLMVPLSDAGKPRLDSNWEQWIKTTTIADKSEDSDIIRARLEQIEQEEGKKDGANAEILIEEETRFLNTAERLKSRTVTLHFKIEELGDRF